MPAATQPDIRVAVAGAVDRVADLALRICAVPAPTGDEHRRAAFVADRLRGLGYPVEIDPIGNVYTRRGDRGGPGVAVVAHTDTVFPEGTELAVSRDGDTLRGPGIGDNSLSVAAVIVGLGLLDELGVATEADLLVVANVGEEGLGNLRGARAAFERFGGDAAAAVVVDGRLGHVTHVAVGSVRWRVTVRGPGGHSFADFGLPSAIHGLARIVAGLAALDVLAEPKTTFNVGTIAGGTSVNTIAPEASAVVDLRSTDAVALARLADRAREIVETNADDGLTAEIEVLGERPAGARDARDPLVRMAIEGLRAIGREPSLHAASTDANVPIGLGIPTVCVGISEGEGAHTIHESVRVAPIADGLAHVLQLCVDTAAWVAAGRPA